MVSHAHITRLRPRHAYFSADSGCDRSGVAVVTGDDCVRHQRHLPHLYSDCHCMDIGTWHDMVSMLTLMLLSLMIAVQY